MISGRVKLAGYVGTHPVLHPDVTVAIAGGDGVFRSVECTVDTGFTGWLSLPQTIIRGFGLLYQGQRPVVLADGSERMVPIYLASISWHNRTLRRLVHRSDSSPLIGMGLLSGSLLTVAAVEGGEVRIEEIPPTPPASIPP